MKTKLTRRLVEGLEPPEKGELMVLDTQLPGFALRLRKGGAKTYVLRYRPRGGGRAVSPRTLTIGRHPALTPEQAREIAQRHLGDIAAGADPARERPVYEERTVAEAIGAYLDELQGRASHYNMTRLAELHLLPAIGGRRLGELARVEVEDLKRKLERAGKRRTAAACVTLLRTALKRAGVDEEAARVKVRTWRKRERAASAEELGRVLRATRDLVDEGGIWPWAGYLILLLILTGARPSEIRTAKWSDVDLAKGVLTRREHKTADKTGEARVIHLAPEAIALLERMPRINGNPYLIPGKVRGEPLRIYDKPWRAIQERAGVEGLWVYDLRRTWASMALGSGASREQIARALGHSDLSAVSGYAWLLPGARAEIAGRVGSLVAQLDGPPTPQEPGEDRAPSGRS